MSDNQYVKSDGVSFQRQRSDAFLKHTLQKCCWLKITLGGMNLNSFHKFLKLFLQIQQLQWDDSNAQEWFVVCFLCLEFTSGPKCVQTHVVLLHTLTKPLFSVPGGHSSCCIIANFFETGETLVSF